MKKRWFLLLCCKKKLLLCNKQTTMRINDTKERKGKPNASSHRNSGKNLLIATGNHQEWKQMPCREKGCFSLPPCISVFCLPSEMSCLSQTQKSDRKIFCSSRPKRDKIYPMKTKLDHLQSDHRKLFEVVLETTEYMYSTGVQLFFLETQFYFLLASAIRFSIHSNSWSIVSSASSCEKSPW